MAAAGSSTEQFRASVVRRVMAAREIKQIHDAISLIKEWGAVVCEPPFNARKSLEDSEWNTDVATKGWGTLTTFIPEMFNDHFNLFADALQSAPDVIIRAKDSRIDPMAAREDRSLKGAIVCEATLRFCQEICTHVTGLHNDGSASRDPPLNIKGIVLLISVLMARLMDQLLECVPHAQASIQMAAADLFAAIGNPLMVPWTISKRTRMIAFVLSCASSSTVIPYNVRNKFCRCLALFVEYPCLRENANFFLDVFTMLERDMPETQGNLRCTQTWLFGNWADILVETYGEGKLDPTKENLVIRVLKVTQLSSDVPSKGKYNVPRIYGRVLQWMSEAYVADSQVQSHLKIIAKKLSGMIGVGTDYKVRWNAAAAVAHALKNPALLSMREDIIVPMLNGLSKWVAKSQNYKERTQCFKSLGEAPTRFVYGDLYAHVWDRVCLALSTLPIEECDSAEKFKVEGCMTLLHLMSLLKKDDVPKIFATVNANYEIIKTTIIENAASILPERSEVTLNARDNLIKWQWATEYHQNRMLIRRMLDILEEICD